MKKRLNSVQSYIPGTSYVYSDIVLKFLIELGCHLLHLLLLKTTRFLVLLLLNCNLESSSL